MKNILIGLLLLCVGALLGTMLTRSLSQIPTPEPIVIRDTITEIKIDTQYFAKPEPYKVVVIDTIYIPQQGANLVQEIKEYKDSSYYARISGINAYLEEIKVFPKTTTQYIYQMEKVYQKRKKWGIGVSAGYCATTQGLQPYIGIGVSYNIIQW